MRNIFSYFLLILLVFPVAAMAMQTSGLPVPRFVSLKSDEVNMRTGPGERYPIEWVYRRAGLPVEVVEEYDYWRRIRDADGTTGWVHKSMLSGTRMVSITGKEAQVLRIDPAPDAKPLLKAEPKVIGRLLECNPEWCRIEVAGRKGWIEKKHLWGVFPQEIFD